MRSLPYHISVESVRWREALPSLHLFDTFRIALHPAMLGIAYVYVVLLHVGGLVLDWLWQGSPYQGAVGLVLGLFRRFVDAALHLNLGLTSGFDPDRTTMAGSILGMVWGVPTRVWGYYPWFVVTYLAYAFLLMPLFGGAMSRLAAARASRGLGVGSVPALRFSGRRYASYALAPLLPLAVAAVLALLLGLAGLVFFNLPVLDVVGGLLYGLLLLVGFALALTLLGFAVGVHLLYPAISIEGADAFDAISRSYNYVLGRLGRFALYALLSLIFFAITYVVVSLVVYAALWLTDAMLAWGSFADLGRAPDRYGAISAMAVDPATRAEGTPGAAAWLVSLWKWAFVLVLPAYIVSFYFSAATWVYLLLRRSADQVYFDELYMPDDDASANNAPKPTPTDEVPAPPSDDAASQNA